MSVSWASKDAGETRTYRYSWLGRLNGAEIASATLSVNYGTVVLTNVSSDANSITATVSGGAHCEDAELISTVVTDAGETLSEAISLNIRSSRHLNAGPSTSTKRQIVEMAYKECALAGYEFNVTPEELFSGLRDLDGLMAQWAAEGIGLNYNAPAQFGQGDLEDYSGIPDAAIVGASINLAMAIAPGMGKALSAETKARLARSTATIRAMTAVIPEIGYSYGTIAGAGNRSPRNFGTPYLPQGRRCR